MFTPRWVMALPLIAGLGCSRPAAGEEPARAEPVLIELFTSQGCSSCPPADAALTRLAAELGDRVIPLAFHVDYWNDLGWSDPFSSPAWSQRQASYAASLPSRVYTPQLVIDGRADLVGSHRREAVEAITAAAARPHPARVALRRDGRDLIATFDIGVGAHAADVQLAVTSSGQQTAVPRGENAGRTLANDFVVRSLQRIGSIDGRPGRSELRAHLPIRAGRAVVFVQERGTNVILGASALPL